MGNDPGGSRHASGLTPSALAELDGYLAAVERRMKEAGTYSPDAIDDLRAHVYAELASVSPPDEAAVKSVIRRLGAPEDVANSAEPGATPAPRTARKITLVLALLAPFAAFLALVPLWIGLPAILHPPSALGPTGISEGTALWQTRIFYQEKFARISDVRFGELDGEPGQELGVLEDRRALFFELDGSVKSKVYFDDRIYSPRFVDVDFNGHTEFLAPGGAFQKVVLLNDSGHAVWSWPAPSDPPNTLPPHDTAAGDVDNDGRTEFAMATTGAVELVDANGQVRWRRASGGATKVFIVDLDENGRRGIVHNQMFEGILVRDKNGDVISTGSPTDSGPFTTVAWPNARGGSHLLMAEKDRLRILTYEGKAIAELAVPGLRVGPAGMDPKLHVCYARISLEHPSTLVVLVEFRDTSLLVAFEGQTRIYREVISAACSALTTAREDADEYDDLFVACHDKVFEYTPGR